MRAGDALAYVCGVNASTGSSLGDDLSISIHGFEPSETATLLDGHEIGPIGAMGSGYDYQVSPFYGLRDVSVIFGSGATGLSGASTIAGAVNFLTLEPSREPHLGVTAGYGTFNHGLAGVQATGTIGKLGYAFAHGAQGTDGSFNNGVVSQTGNFGQDITANRQANTYFVSADFNKRITLES